MADSTDRLEVIAANRGTEPDVRWLLDEVLRLRDELDYEHGVVLDLSEVTLRRLAVISRDVTALLDGVNNRRR